MTQVEFPATFPRSARLLTPGDFSAVFEQRNARRGRFFHLHLGAAVPAASATGEAALPACPRIGIAVPKKLLRTAVHRNVVKRIAREVFRQARGQLDGRDYVLRLAVKLDPKRQPLDRQALARDIGTLLSGRQPRRQPQAAPGADAAAPGQRDRC